jgi:TrmH family RNA methyltransferase
LTKSHQSQNDESPHKTLFTLQKERSRYLNRQLAIGNWQSQMIITSRDNSLLRQARAVRDGKAPESIFVEGLRLCEEALSSGLTIEAVIFSEEIAPKKRAADLIKRLGKTSDKIASVSEDLLKSISYTKTPQGIVLLAARPAGDEVSFNMKQPATPFLVVLHGINNPVNVGAIIRTAEAAGVTGIVSTTGTSDPFSPKALRGAMGSAFRLPVWSGSNYEQALAWCRERKLRTVCADVHSSKDYRELDWRGPRALIVGPESNGLSPAEIAAADEAVRIPMQGSVESLNVAMAAGIILYEANRQRSGA